MKSKLRCITVIESLSMCLCTDTHSYRRDRQRERETRINPQAGKSPSVLKRLF